MEPSRQDVIKTLKFPYKDNERLDKYMDEMYPKGGTMSTMATQYIIARSLIRNPQNYAQIVNTPERSDKSFHANPDIPTMKTFLIDACLDRPIATTSEVTARRNLLSQFDDDTPTGKSTSDKHKKRRHKK